MNSKDYSFEELWKDLNTGYQVYYTYMNTRYLLSKLTKNCYSREIVEQKRKKSTSKNSNGNIKKCYGIISIYGGYRI